MLHGVAWKGPPEICLLRKDLKEVKKLIPGIRDFQTSVSEQLMQISTCSVGMRGFSSLNSKEASVPGMERASAMVMGYE